MFTKFAIERELSLTSYFSENKPLLIKSAKLDLLLSYNLKNFRFVSFSKPRLIEASLFLSFFILSNGSLVFVDFSFNKLNKGFLLFDDLYTF